MYLETKWNRTGNFLFFDGKKTKFPLSKWTTKTKNQTNKNQAKKKKKIPKQPDWFWIACGLQFCVQSWNPEGISKPSYRNFIMEMLSNA